MALAKMTSGECLDDFQRRRPRSSRRRDQQVHMTDLAGRSNALRNGQREHTMSDHRLCVKKGIPKQNVTMSPNVLHAIYLTTNNRNTSGL